MRLSKNLLYNWIHRKIDINKICKQLTYSGLEVEEIKNIVHHDNNIKIGQILSIQKHPKKNFLIILTVDIGEKKFLHVVTYKEKFIIHMKIVIAIYGSILANNIIKKKNILGVLSEGIVCYFHHFNIYHKKKCFIELSRFAPVGLEFSNYHIYKDQLIKINITPNRLDALGIIGITREIAILNNLPIPKIFNIRIPTFIKNRCRIKCNILNTVYCSFSKIIQGINLKTKTPRWMKEILRKCHISSVNIVIDIVNYVFIKFGHSLYIFSFLNNIYDIVIRFLQPDENIFSNKNKKKYINDKIIVLSNNAKIISFLGNINFHDFPIDLNNQSLCITSIFLDPKLIYNSIYQLKKQNEFYKKNEYYIDPSNQKTIIEYTTNLFIKICGGFSGPITSNYSENYYTYINRTIQLNYNNIKKIIGYNIGSNIITKLLKQSYYFLIFQKDNSWYVIPPIWRLDILSEEDIISDIIRIYQYNNILSQPLVSNHIIIQNNMIEYSLKRVKYLLIDQGYHEVINYSFIDPKIQSLLYPKKNFLLLMNPISQDMSCMRYSLWPGLIKNTCYHQNRQYEEIQLFESGLCFLPNPKEKLGVTQALYLSGIISNNFCKNHWDTPAKKIDFYDIKGDIESIFDVLGILHYIDFKKCILSSLHPEYSASIFFKNEIIGYFGLLNTNLLELLHLQHSIFLFEIHWYKLNFIDTINIKNISDFPYIRRDISIIIDENIDVNSILLFCKGKFQEILLDIRIFDIYHGPNIPNNKKSISLTFIFQSILKTLQDKEIDDIMKQYLQYLKKKFNAFLRKK